MMAAPSSPMGHVLSCLHRRTAVLQLGNPSEYCQDANHNGAANNDQNNFNGGSCWKHMAKDAKHNNIPYGLVVPGADGPATCTPPQPCRLPSVCTELIPVQRFMLVLDRSGSMLGTKIDQLKIGANFWVDYVNSAEELGLVTYAGIETLDFPKSAVPSGAAAQTAWRNTRHTAVDGISASGATAIGDALRVGLTRSCREAGHRDQVMILFTDGLQNAGSETAEDVLPDCVAGGVRATPSGSATTKTRSFSATSPRPLARRTFRSTAICRRRSRNGDH